MLSQIPILIFLISLLAPADKQSALIGAWQAKDDSGNALAMIVSENYFSVAAYKQDPPEFSYTYGGTWELSGNNSTIKYEFNTANPDQVGKSENFEITLMDDNLSMNDTRWTRIDEGKPGKLEGAWLITGRKRDGEISMRTPGARKTMKILSGTRFQWIAYNSETGEFSGTGGGTYTTKRGKYTETIQFFSRDNSRVGAELEFNYELQVGSWHHSGLSSTGVPLYEVWETRISLGI